MTDSAPRPQQSRHSFPGTGLQFQLAFVFLHEGFQFIGAGQQPRPLFVIERHRKPPEAVYADGSLFTHSEFQLRWFLGLSLLFQFRDPFSNSSLVGSDLPWWTPALLHHFA